MRDHVWSYFTMCFFLQEINGEYLIGSWTARPKHSQTLVTNPQKDYENVKFITIYGKDNEKVAELTP